MFILKLLNHVTEPVIYKEIEDIGKNFKIEDNVELYTVTINKHKQSMFIFICF